MNYFVTVFFGMCYSILAPPWASIGSWLDYTERRVVYQMVWRWSERSWDTCHKTTNKTGSVEIKSAHTYRVLDVSDRCLCLNPQMGE